jgi:hypothetical protein
VAPREQMLHQQSLTALDGDPHDRGVTEGRERDTQLLETRTVMRHPQREPRAPIGIAWTW